MEWRNMSAIVASLCLFMLYNTHSVLAQCQHRLFTYEAEDFANKKIYGIVKISTSDIQNSLLLEVSFDIDIIEFAVLPLTGDVNYKDAKTFIINNTAPNLLTGGSTYIPFMIEYESNSIPKIKKILLNDRQLCNETIYIKNDDFLMTTQSLRKWFPNTNTENSTNSKTTASLEIIATTVAIFEPNTLYSDCPQIYLYQVLSKVPGRMCGLVKLRPETVQYPLLLDIKMNQKVSAVEVLLDFAIVTTKDNFSYRIYIKDPIKISDESTILPLAIQYTNLKTLPKVQMAQLNGKQICNSYTQPVTDGQQSSLDNRNGVENQPFTNVSVAPLTIPAITQDKYTGKCGFSIYQGDPNPLVVGGKRTREAEWPWQIALYWNEEKVNIKFKCGGTLVTLTHVITAAHCVMLKQPDRRVEIDILSVILGKHNLRTSRTGAQTKYVDDFVVHPKFSSSAFLYDIAVLTIQKAEYTDWVRPACLWPEDQADFNYVAGKKGVVVGWGRNDNDELTEELKQVDIPIIEHLECISSNIDFFPKFIGSNKPTFCGGLRDGSAPCNGDSGGGMMIYMKSRWYLRGIVSISVSKGQTTCDPDHYVVFTDVGQLLDWIKIYIKI